jgi:Carboxypeptidase regulatory-like domain
MLTVASSSLGLGQETTKLTVDDAVSPTADGTRLSYDFLQLRARGAVALRNGSQSESETSPTLAYQGITPNDLSLRGWWWFALDRSLGATLEIQREAFTLFETESRVTGGALLRAHVGPTARFRFGPFRIEPTVGYAFHQLPRFGTSATPALISITRHALYVALLARLDLGIVTIEAQGDAPFALGTSDSSRAQGYGVGGAVRVQVFRIGKAHVGLLANVNFQRDILGPQAGPTSVQSVTRIGLGVDVMFRDEIPAAPVAAVAQTGSLRLHFQNEAGANLEGVRARVFGAAEGLGTADANGNLTLKDLTAGTSSLELTMNGFEAQTRPIEIAAQQIKSETVTLVAIKPKTGSVALKVTNAQDKKPLAKVRLQLGSESKETDDQGLATFAEVPIGNVSIAATAAEFKPGSEAVSVVGGKRSEVTLELVPLKVRLPAAIKGLVRALKTGQPVAADIEIPELKLKSRADASGTFAIPLAGGNYTIRISAKGFVTQTKSVVVRDGDSTIFNVDLSLK